MTRALIVALAALACVLGLAAPAAAGSTPAGPDTAAGWPWASVALTVGEIVAILAYWSTAAAGATTRTHSEE